MKPYKASERTGIDWWGRWISAEGGRVRVGMSCAACHATVDPQTKKVVEEAPNNDLNAGRLELTSLLPLRNFQRCRLSLRTD